MSHTPRSSIGTTTVDPDY